VYNIIRISYEFNIIFAGRQGLPAAVNFFCCIRTFLQRPAL
jgi:hypothetical protein